MSVLAFNINTITQEDAYNWFCHSCKSARIIRNERVIEYNHYIHKSIRDFINSADSIQFLELTAYNNKPMYLWTSWFCLEKQKR